MAGTASSYVSGVAGAPLLGDTVGAALANTVARFPNREALVSIHQGVRYSYREFAGEVERVALGLLALGIEKGDRVGIWAPNCVEWTILQFATARASARSSSTSTRRIARASSNSRWRTPACACWSRRRDSRHPTISRCSPRCARHFLRSNGLSRSTVSAPLPPISSGPSWSRRHQGRRPSNSPSEKAGSTPTTRSTSSTRAARPAAQRARPSRTTTS